MVRNLLPLFFLLASDNIQQETDFACQSKKGCFYKQIKSSPQVVMSSISLRDYGLTFSIRREIAWSEGTGSFFWAIPTFVLFSKEFMGLPTNEIKDVLLSISWVFDGDWILNSKNFERPFKQCFQEWKFLEGKELKKLWGYQKKDL